MGGRNFVFRFFTRIPSRISVRFGSSELANIAALVGGLVSQEIIKLITRQYIPIDNTVIFDGTRAMSSTFQL